MSSIRTFALLLCFDMWSLVGCAEELQAPAPAGEACERDADCAAACGVGPVCVRGHCQQGDAGVNAQAKPCDL